MKYEYIITEHYESNKIRHTQHWIYFFIHWTTTTKKAKYWMNTTQELWQNGVYTLQCVYKLYLKKSKTYSKERKRVVCLKKVTSDCGTSIMLLILLSMNGKGTQKKSWKWTWMNSEVNCYTLWYEPSLIQMIIIRIKGGNINTRTDINPLVRAHFYSKTQPKHAKAFKF